MDEAGGPTGPRASASELGLATPIGRVPGVGARRAGPLIRLGVRSLAHLIDHLPHRHERIEAERPLGEIEEGQLVSVRGEVVKTRIAGRSRGKGRFEAILADETGRIDIAWFNQTFLQRKIRPGMWLRVQGKVGTYGPSLQLTNPRWEALGEVELASAPAGEARLRPVYPAGEGVTSEAIERLIDGVLDGALPLLDDHLPDGLRRERAMPTLRDAYRMMHRPSDEEEVGTARRRLVYDELLLLQVGVQLRRAHLRRTVEAPALAWSDEIDRRIRARLPFELTEGQERVVAELVEDLRGNAPANRLIQGDVGAGKTAVAVYAMLMGAASDRQSALLAPTELLAEQHFASVKAMLEGARVSVELLTGGLGRAERARVEAGLASGDVDIVVGTHALLTESVVFEALGVAVIDEQHRFGVHQRAALRGKAGEGRSPHVLVMTATPIPRTLALTVFGDLDVSVLRGLPPGRRPIATRLIEPSGRPAAYEELRARLDAGEQGYVVVPAVEGEEGGLRDVRTTIAELESGPLAGRRVAGVHGRLARETRDHVMGRFRAGLIDVLVATTVIEVGVDVPNATVMIIEDAERFGLAQLHQIRGRVGRGSKPGLCIVVSSAPTPESASRLSALVSTTDGFELADKDLALRGAGEFFGLRQSGAAPFRLADFPRDTELLLMARRDAVAIVRDDPALAGAGHALLARRLKKRHGDELDLASVA